MSITAAVKNYLRYTGDQEQELVFDTGSLEDSPALQELKTLAVGNNEIEVPDTEDFTVHGLMLVPPSLNEVEFVLKGVNGDTGITLSATEVTVLQLGTLPATIVISVDEEVVGLRLIWF